LRILLVYARSATLAGYFGKAMPVTGAEQAKLKELILYIAARMESDDHAGQGRIKLAKLLWLSDFEAFRRFGKSITGARYVADELGPAPVDELLALRDLEGSGYLVLEPGYDRQRLPRAQRPPDTEVFSDDELAVVDELLERYRGWTGKQLVDLAHEFPGYRIVERGAEVPYRSVYISAQGPTASDIARAEEVAREHGWT
jgi:hypothetical protein